MNKLVITLFYISLSFSLFSQSDALQKAERRFNFAEGTLGFDLSYVPSAGTGKYIDSEGNINEFNFPTSLTPRFTISGLHFWRNVDMYITIPFFNVLGGKMDELESLYNIGSETGIKFYPWKVKDNSIRPYAGISWNLMQYRQKVGDLDGQTITRSRAPLQFGFTYNNGDKLLEIGGTYNYQNELEYAIDRNTFTNIEFPQLSFHLGYRWIFETSLKDAPELADGTIQRQIDKLRARNKLSGFSFALGLSSTLMGRNDYNKNNYPFLDRLSLANSHFDAGIGYYHEPTDAHLNLAFRNMTFNTTSFGFEQKFSRMSLGLEIYKFLFDYHGFVPYLGIIPSYERHIFSNTDNTNLIYENTENKWTGGLIFGWDIRQDSRQWYILRTNLRYYPMKVTIDGTAHKFNQFEFNFIQFVYYPSRHKWIKKVRRGDL